MAQAAAAGGGAGMSALVFAACQPWPASGPVTFQQGTCYTPAPHAAPWWTPLNTETPLWLYLAVVALILLASWSASWVKDHYELVAGRPVRRWYGTGAYVLRPGTPGSGPVLRLQVL